MPRSSHHKETQTEVVPFIRSGQNNLARHSDRWKKTRKTKDEMETTNQGMDRPRARRVPKGGGEQRKMEESGCEVICGTPTTLAVKGRVKGWVKALSPVSHKGFRQG